MIILVGVAGAGKSMQGRLLSDERGFAWISTGEILRVLVTGKRRQEMLEGKLLSDAEMIRMMDKVLDLINLSEEFILDGFPRTTKQADWLVDQVHMERFKITGIINLVTTEDVVMKRLQKRGRPDDTEDAIRHRFEEYEAVTKPLIKHLQENGIPVWDIDADQDPKVVHAQIMKRLPQEEPQE